MWEKIERKFMVGEKIEKKSERKMRDKWEKIWREVKVGKKWEKGGTKVEEKSRYQKSGRKVREN